MSSSDLYPIRLHQSCRIIIRIGIIYYVRIVHHYIVCLFNRLCTKMPVCVSHDNVADGRRNTTLHKGCSHITLSPLSVDDNNQCYEHDIKLGLLFKYSDTQNDIYTMYSAL